MATPWLTGQGSQAQEVPPKEFTSSEIFPETSNEIACEQCGLGAVRPADGFSSSAVDTKRFSSDAIAQTGRTIGLHIRYADR